MHFSVVVQRSLTAFEGTFTSWKFISERRSGSTWGLQWRCCLASSLCSGHLTAETWKIWFVNDMYLVEARCAFSALICFRVSIIFGTIIYEWTWRRGWWRRFYFSFLWPHLRGCGIPIRPYCLEARGCQDCWRTMKCVWRYVCNWEIPHRRIRRALSRPS